MSSDTVTVYYRVTNGQGQKITIPISSQISALYELIADLTQTTPDMIRLFIQGTQLIPNSSSRTFKPETIIHVRRKLQIPYPEKIVCITINWQNQEYSYRIHPLSTIEYLKKQITRDIAEWNKKIILSYLGAELNDYQTLADVNIQNNSKLSLCMVPQQNTHNINFLRPKIAKSITFRQELVENKISIKPVERELLEQKNILSINPSQQFLSSQPTWFATRKIIETQSINCDESFEDNNPDFWLNCEFQVKSIQKTREYTFDCGEDHRIEDIVNKLAKIQKCQPCGIVWANQSQIGDIQEFRLLEVARDRNSQILGPYTFKISR